MEWTPKQYMQLVADGTACLCMLITIAGIFLAVIHGFITASILGEYKTGAGLVGVLFVMYLVIKKSLS